MTALRIICCSVLRQEIEEVLRQDHPDVHPIFTDSMLHMHPEKLHQAMEEILSGLTADPCLLVYGDCHPYMHDMENRPNRQRTEALNCCDLLLGREMYAKYQTEKAFLFLPEWTCRWREIFQRELGFSDQSLAREFMKEYRRQLIYLDTGLSPVPEKITREISEFFDMPMTIVPVTLDKLRDALASAIKRLLAGSPHER